MSPILPLFLSLMLIQPATDVVKPEPETQPAAVQVESEYPVPPGAPSDDYGLVAWCYGALAGHMQLYDKVIGDVEAIEVEIGKIPGAPPADMASYKLQREAGRDTLKQFQRSMEAAEKASPRPIAPYGAESLKAGGAIWTKVRGGDSKYLAREWMSWGLPGRCLPTAERLEARSSLFGQALSYNVKPAEEAQPEAAPAEDAADAAADAAVDETEASDGVEDKNSDPADMTEEAADVTTAEDAAADEAATDDAATVDAATDEAAADDTPTVDAAPSSIDDLLPGEDASDASADDDQAVDAEEPPEDKAAPANDEAATSTAATALRGPL